MANPNAVVSIVLGLDPPQVELQGGRRARLDPANPLSAGFAQILDALLKQRRPVYLEIDPPSAAITRLLIPHVTRVGGVRPFDEGALDVQLDFSHARHTLRRDQQDFAELERQLRDALQSRALVIVTEDDAHNILHIRLFRPGPDGPPPPFPEPEPRPRWPIPWLKKLRKLVEPWRWLPWRFKCLTLAQAQQVFDALNATSCDPLTVPPPCIPFLYPDDGCSARAHEMCRLMIAMGHSPKKVWISGNFNVSTPNNPSCHVVWNWHVAPFLCVRGQKLYTKVDMVFDPALFTTLVTKSAWRWKIAGADPDLTMTDSEPSVYWLWGNTSDPLYESTKYQLEDWRLQLQLRALEKGPPPYACS